MSTVQLRRIDSSRNMARFYMLTVQPSLFGEWCLVREWGRIGSPGRVASTPFPSPALAEAALDKWQHQKVRKGYSEPSMPCDRTERVV